MQACLDKYATELDREKFKDVGHALFSILPESVLRHMGISDDMVRGQIAYRKAFADTLNETLRKSREAPGTTRGVERVDSVRPPSRTKSPDYAYHTEALPVEGLYRATHQPKLGENCCGGYSDPLERQGRLTRRTSRMRDNPHEGHCRGTHREEDVPERRRRSSRSAKPESDRIP